MAKRVAVVGEDGWVSRGIIVAEGTEDERFEVQDERDLGERVTAAEGALALLRRLGIEPVGVPVASQGTEPEWTVEIAEEGHDERAVTLARDVLGIEVKVFRF